ncbi:MAG: Crp/Fnr family transcriptional regulator [Acidobacteriota bacterium]
MFKTIEKVLLLHEVDLFSLAQTEHLGELAAVCQVREVQVGKILFKAGEPSKRLRILVEGRVRLGEGEEVRELSSVSSLDEWAFLAEAGHSCRAEAVQDSVLLEISFEDLSDILTAEPELCLALLRYLARQGQKMIERA